MAVVGDLELEDVRFGDHWWFKDFHQKFEGDERIQIDHPTSRMNWNDTGCGCCSIHTEVESKEDKITVLNRYLVVLEERKKEVGALLFQINNTKPEEHMGQCGICHNDVPMTDLQNHIEECDGEDDDQS